MEIAFLDSEKKKKGRTFPVMNVYPLLEIVSRLIKVVKLYKESVLIEFIFYKSTGPNMSIAEETP